jgi:predicted permease
MIGPLNRLVYYLAIPAMVFREVAQAPFHAHFQPLLLGTTLLSAGTFVFWLGFNY